MFFINQILPNLYLGSWQSSSKELLLQNQIKTVFHFGFEPEEHLEGITYNSFQIDDNAQSLSLIKDKLAGIHQLIEEAIREGNVLVCCSAGKSRSVTIMISFLILRKGLTFREAYDLVKDKRSVINPNPIFLDFLKSV